MIFIQQSLPKPQVKHSDVDCLNLNITVPKLAYGLGSLSKQKLPVFIWTHGGGFVVGANSWPQYDHAKLVKIAAKNGVPIIGVGIKYVSDKLCIDRKTRLMFAKVFDSGFPAF